MADNYTMFSLVVQLKAEEVGWVRKQLSEDAEGVPLWIRELKTTEYKEILRRACVEIHDDYTNFMYEIGPDESDIAERSLWIYSEDHGDVEHVVGFLLKFLHRFSSEMVVGFEWANTCSKPRIGEFGGGGCVVHRDGAKWFFSSVFIDVEAKKLLDARPQTVTFSVKAISEQPNSFGLWGMQVESACGDKWECAANSLNKLKVGDTFTLQKTNGAYAWHQRPFEIPRQINPKE